MVVSASECVTFFLDSKYSCMRNEKESIDSENAFTVSIHTNALTDPGSGLTQLVLVDLWVNTTLLMVVGVLMQGRSPTPQIRKLCSSPHFQPRAGRDEVNSLALILDLSRSVLWSHAAGLIGRFGGYVRCSAETPIVSIGHGPRTL